MPKSNSGIVVSGKGQIRAVNVVAGEGHRITVVRDIAHTLKRKGRPEIADALATLSTAINQNRPALDNVDEVDDCLYDVADALRREPADRPRVMQALENLGRLAGTVATIASAVEAVKSAVQ